MRGPRLCLSILLCSAVWCAPAGADLRLLERHTPRPFGFFIGDLIRHRVVAETDPDWVLAQATLPAPQALTYWLDLRDIRVHSEQRADGRRYVIDLEYQVFYAALTATRLEIPPFRLGFNTEGGEGALIEREVPAWPFMVSSLRGLEGGVTGQEGPLRADVVPQPTDTRSARWRLLGFASSTLLLGLLVLHHHARWPFDLRPARPFTRAARQLRRASRTGGQAAERMQALHRAFDDTAGKRLFADDLVEFFSAHPGFDRHTQDIHRFFTASRELFFADHQGAVTSTFDNADALRLAVHLARVERQVR